PVVDALARKVRIGAVGECHGDIGQAVERNGALGDQAGDGVQAQLHRHRDQPFHLFRRMSRPLRDDVHHRRRQVRIRIHRQHVVGPYAGRGQPQRQQHHQQALLQREGDDAVDQRRRARRRSLDWRLLAHWVWMKCRKIAPSTTTLSPAWSPSGIRKRSSTRSPSVTVRCAQPPSAAATYTNGRFSSSRRTADTGTSNPVRASLDWMRTRTYICRFSTPSGLATSTRASTERVSGSSTAPTLVTLPWIAVPSEPGSTRAASPFFTVSDSSPNNCAMTHICEVSAMVKHGVEPAASSWPGAIDFSTTLPAIGARITPWPCATGLPSRIAAIVC